MSERLVDLQKMLMNLNPDSIESEIMKIKTSMWVASEGEHVVIAHCISLSALYRPYSTCLLGQFVKGITSGGPKDTEIKTAILDDIFRKMLSRGYTPTRSSLGSLLFWCVQENGLTISEVVTHTKKFEASSSNFETIAFNAFVWLAPEIEKDDPAFFSRCTSIVERMSAREGLYPTVQRYLFDFEKLRGNEWAELIKRRASTRALRIFSAFFKRNDVEALMELSVHPAFNIDQKIAQSIYEPGFFVSNGPSMIEFAAYCGAIDCFEFLLQNGADIMASDNNGLVLRDFAVAGGDSEIMSIWETVDPNFSDAAHVKAQFYRQGFVVSEKSAFAAANSGNMEALMACLDGGVDANAVDHKGRTLLMVSAQYQHADMVEMLLAAGVNVNAQDSEGFTALQCACQNGSLRVVVILLRAPGIDVMLRQRFGMSPLHWAAQKGFLDIVERLLNDARVDATAVDDEKWTPLHFASQVGHCDVMRALIAHPNVDINARQQDGMSPLLFAASGGLCDCVRVLTESAALNVGVTDNDGLTAVHWAAQHGHAMVIEVLATHPNIDMNVADNDGWAAIFWAAQHDHVGAVGVLLKCEAVDANVREKNDMTALHVAAMNGAKAVCHEMLLCDKVDVDARDHLDQPPVHFACRNGDPELLELFTSSPRVKSDLIR